MSPLRASDNGTYSGEFLSGQRTEILQGVALAGGSSVIFSFQMIDASNALEGAAVLIRDGTVFGPNNDIAPAGMPSNDTYVLPIEGNAFYVYLVLTVSQSDGQLTSCSLAQGAVTPDDSGGTFYITIGRVPIDYSSTVPKCFPRNTVCGDVGIDVLPTTGLDETKNWAWGFDTSDGNEKWIQLCTGNTCP